jgi:hypothetical protein
MGTRERLERGGSLFHWNAPALGSHLHPSSDPDIQMQD